jgi:hypothetical protein
MHRIEIGFGGGFEGLTDLAFADRMARLRSSLAAIDPNARIDYIEGMPATRVEARIAEDAGMPIRQATHLYVIGGGLGQPDARDSLRRNLDAALATGTMDRLNMQVAGDAIWPRVDDLVAFYRDAYAVADAAGIELFTETHVDRFTEDPRRLLEVDAALRAAHGGRGLQICADFSHYVRQIRNPQATTSLSQEAGRLELDPDQADNILDRYIVGHWPIRYGHMRCATPSALGRGQGSLQYPLVDPASDPERPWHGPLRGYGPWDAARTRPWQVWHERIFAAHAAHPAWGVARFASEFIRYGEDYRIDDYRNAWQNLNVIAWACNLRRRVMPTAS